MLYNCSYCAHEFKSKYKSKKHKFCSIECHHSFIQVDKETRTCPFCNISFIVRKTDRRKFCTKSCSTTYHNVRREISIETKDKIKNSIIAYHTERGVEPKWKSSKIKYSECNKCTKTFIEKYRGRASFCKNCKMQMSNEYRVLCKFNLNKTDHPELFNGSLINKYGWYRPHSTKTPNYTGVTWDHLYPIYKGFIEGVSPDIMSHPANAELIPFEENLRRYREKKQIITLDVLMNRIQLWESGMKNLPIFYEEKLPSPQ